MSGLPSVRAALETSLAAITPALPTAYENVAYTPAPGVAYQRAYLLAAAPDNTEIGPGYTERGFMQVSLFYPLGGGPAAAEARAELIRAKFPFASTHTAGGTRVLITQTPEIAPARTEDDAHMVVVRIRFESHS